MGIVFHCEHCGKKIQAQDSAGGKWGKCPKCHNKLYIPNPEPEEEEELKLAPIDESAVEKRKHLMAETYKVAEAMLDEKQVPNELTGTTSKSAADTSDEQLAINVITYLRYMADGELEQAEKSVNLIIRCGKRAVKVLDEIAVSEIPEPELADIPQQVLSGLIKTLRGKIR